MISVARARTHTHTHLADAVSCSHTSLHSLRRDVGQCVRVHDSLCERAYVLPPSSSSSSSSSSSISFHDSSSSNDKNKMRGCAGAAPVRALACVCARAGAPVLGSRYVSRAVQMWTHPSGWFCPCTSRSKTQIRSLKRRWCERAALSTARGTNGSHTHSHTHTRTHGHGPDRSGTHPTHTHTHTPTDRPERLTDRQAAAAPTTGSVRSV